MECVVAPATYGYRCVPLHCRLPIAHVCVAFHGNDPGWWEVSVSSLFLKLMNVVEVHNQVPALLIFAPFPLPLLCHLLYYQNLKSVAKRRGGVSVYPDVGRVAQSELSLNAL